MVHQLVVVVVVHQVLLQERVHLVCHHALVNATAQRHTRASRTHPCAHVRVAVFVELDATTQQCIVAVKFRQRILLVIWCWERISVPILFQTKVFVVRVARKLESELLHAIRNVNTCKYWIG